MRPATQKIFALARPLSDITWEDLAPLMQTEAAYVWSLYEQGVLRDAWMRTDALGAVYVLEAAPADARRLLAEQPVARHGCVAFELIPVGPFIPFSLLFGTRSSPILPCSTPLRREIASHRVLALGRPSAETTPEDLAPHMSDEAAHAWSLSKAGTIRENYLRTDRPGAALMLEVPEAVSAHAVLGGLPLVKAGLIEFECLSLATFIGFDALFEGSLDDAPELLADPTAPGTTRQRPRSCWCTAPGCLTAA